MRSFLASRGIKLPEGRTSDPIDAKTVGGLGNRKNELVLAMIERDGVEPYEGSVRFVKAAIEAGLRRAVVSSSANSESVLRAPGIDGLFEERIDGEVAEREHLKGKPAPDTYLAAAAALDVNPTRQPSSMTRSLGSRPGGRADSAASSASTAPITRRRCASTAPASSSPIWPSY